jgi:hypothetical protein
MKKKFVYYKDYGSATIDKVLSSKQIKESLVLSVYLLESGWWKNDKGHFTFYPFPVQAQISPSNGIVVTDFNQDHHPDILLAGNKYGMEVETGRLDAGIGSLLENDGKGNFSWINNLKTGFWASKEARDLALLTAPEGKQMIIVSNNNSSVQVYRN